MRLKSHYAVLDVERGRKNLLKVVGGRMTNTPVTGNMVPVTIRGFIIEAHGDDDGVSREFEVIVSDVKCHKVKKRKPQ